MATEIYWRKIRKTGARTGCEFLERYWPGSKVDPRYLSLYQKLMLFDIAVEDSYRNHGQAGVDWYLTTDQAEGTMNVLAVEWDIELHDDVAAASSQLLLKPPGFDDLLPAWSLEAGRLQSRDAHRQMERVTGGAAKNESGIRRRGTSWLADAVANPKAPKATPGGKPPPAKPKAPKAPRGPAPAVPKG
jgi:hypothetical protein